MQPRARQVGVGKKIASYGMRAPLIGVYTVILGICSLVSSLVDRTGAIQHWFACFWSRLILLTAHCPRTIVGAHNIDRSGAAIYACNHLSLLDTPVMYTSLPMQFRILAKKELFKIPFMGWHLQRSGQIPIDRASARASLQSLNEAAKTLRGGMSLVVFPEGGRSRTGEVQEFLGGIFYVAVKAQAPIIPMALVGNFEALPMNNYVIDPQPLTLVVGEPISTEGMTTHDASRLSDIVREKIQDLYYERSHVADPRKTAAPTDKDETPAS